MVRQHHCTNVHEFEQTLRDSEEQGSLVCCNPWGRLESNMTEGLNYSKKFQQQRNNISTLQTSLRLLLGDGVDGLELEVTDTQTRDASPDEGCRTEGQGN